MNSDQVRGRLVEALEMDLIGPKPGSTYETEVLPQAPSRWYLTGFLVPYEAKVEDRQDEAAHEQLELGDGSGGADDDDTPEPPSARRAFFPSSLGISVLVPKDAQSLDVEVMWGDYMAEEEQPPGGGSPQMRWRRKPCLRLLTVSVAKASSKPVGQDVPDTGGLRVVTSVRPVNAAGIGGIADRVPPGARAVSVFLVNDREPKKDELKNEAMVFQAALALRLDRSFVPRPNLRGLVSDEWDEKVADLQYADAYEYAVGHGVATASTVGPDGQCRDVRTAWVPGAEVEKVEPAAVEAVELGMEALAGAVDAAQARSQVGALTAAYKAWIAGQEAKTGSLTGDRKDVARELLRQARRAGDRIEAGIDALSDADVFEAWRIANASMARAARQRQGVAERREPGDVPAPRASPPRSRSRTLENRGEGVFLAFKKPLIEQWLKRQAVVTRGGQLLDGFGVWKKRHASGESKFPGLPYVFVHSLSHLLITAVALECGYAASSIRERIYVGEAGYGLLLSTGSPDADGTLGGLVAVGRRIGEHLRAALDVGRLCSNDPVCAQHQPDNQQVERFLHGAACHGCLLIAEPSCERRNDYLDRALVVATVEGLGAEFFDETS